MKFTLAQYNIIYELARAEEEVVSSDYQEMTERFQ